MDVKFNHVFIRHSINLNFLLFFFMDYKMSLNDIWFDHLWKTYIFNITLTGHGCKIRFGSYMYRHFQEIHTQKYELSLNSLDFLSFKGAIFFLSQLPWQLEVYCCIAWWWHTRVNEWTKYEWKRSKNSCTISWLQHTKNVVLLILQYHVTLGNQHYALIKW